MKLKQVDRIAKSHYNISLVYTQLTNYDSAEAHLDRIEDLRKQIKDTADLNKYIQYTGLYSVIIALT